MLLKKFQFLFVFFGYPFHIFFSQKQTCSPFSKIFKTNKIISSDNKLIYRNIEEK